MSRQRLVVFALILTAIPLAAFTTFVVFDRLYRKNELSSGDNSFIADAGFFLISVFFLLAAFVTPFVLVKIIRKSNK